MRTRAEARRSGLTFYLDAAAALIHAAGHCTGRVNIATGTTVSIARVVKILSEVSGVTDVVWEHDKPEGQLDRSYDVCRLRGVGFTHTSSLEEGLRRTYEWYDTNYPDIRL